MGIQRPQATRQRLAGHAQAQRVGKHLWKQGEDGGAPHRDHSVSVSGTTTMRRAFMSISGTVVSVKGTISGSPPRSGLISIRSPAPKLWIAVTVPSEVPSGATAARPTRSA